MPSPPSSNDDDPRPRKKRKVDPKERTTERLDLSTAHITEEQQPQLERLLNVLHKKRKIVVIAGAGISVSAGIPDFRSATGLFNSLKKEHRLKSSGKDLFDASVYKDDDSTATFHDMVRTLSQHTKSAQPTAFHHLLATLAQEGRLMRLYTQNVDGIDTAMPPLSTKIPLPKKGPWPKTVQLHGSLEYMVCSKCHELSPFEAEQFNGPKPPACQNCVDNDMVRQATDRRSHGIGCLRPRMVLYQEYNPDEDAIGSCAATDMRLRPDAVIVAGTTLKVPGIRRIAREMCNIVRDRKDGVTIWLNNDPEPLGKDLENAWDLVIKGPCDEVARHANMRKWDDPMDYKVVTEDDVSKVKEKQKAAVVIGTPKKPSVLLTAGHLTPGQSPRMLPQIMVKDEPMTPSKRGTKRHLDAQMNLFGAVAVKAPVKKSQTQSKKTTAGRGRLKKETKKEAPAINAVFKASKASTKSTAKALTKLSVHALPPTKTDTISVAVAGKKFTPSTPQKGAKVTKFRNSLPMAQLSDVDRRNNHSPKRPEVESFTPIKSRTPSEQIHEELSRLATSTPTNDSRPSTASSQRYEIERPSSVPHGMNDLLC